MMQGLRIELNEAGGHGEYRASLEDGTHAGILTYQKRGDVLIADHTIVPGSMQGRGIAGELVGRLIDDARANEMKIHPQCSYVVAAFRRHPEWADLKA